MSEQHIKVFTLASSSKGNAVYIRYGSDEILIDAGISAKRLECALMSLGSSLKNIQAIFVTHEHSDHISGLATVSKKYGIPVHLTEKSGHAMLNQAKYAPVAECAVLHTPVYSETVGSLEVRSFPTPHDSVCSVGFTVMAGNDTFALATDLGHISPDVEAALTGAENVILESNHDENMLLCGSYPYDVKLRILSDFGHLSNETSAGRSRKSSPWAARSTYSSRISHPKTICRSSRSPAPRKPSTGQKPRSGSRLWRNQRSSYKMVKLDIIFVGTLKERWLTDAVAEYEKRISAWAIVNNISIRDERLSDQAVSRGGTERYKARRRADNRCDTAALSRHSPLRRGKAAFKSGILGKARLARELRCLRVLLHHWQGRTDCRMRSRKGRRCISRSPK